jgi:hypothetical protein
LKRKEDCKLEATEHKCAWDLVNKKCTDRCPQEYDAVIPGGGFPYEKVGECKSAAKIADCAKKCGKENSCDAFSFTEPEAPPTNTLKKILRCSTPETNCTLFKKGESTTDEIENSEDFSFRVCEKKS